MALAADLGTAVRLRDLPAKEKDARANPDVLTPMSGAARVGRRGGLAGMAAAA